MKDSQSHRCGEASADAEVFAGHGAEPTAALRLNSSGAVPCPTPDQRPNESAGCWFWSDLSPFAQGYVEAIKRSFPTLKEHRPASGGDWVVYFHWTFSDLATEALAAILKDCDQAPYAQAAKPVEPHIASEFGRQFWTKRQNGEYRAFPPLTPHLDGAGKVRLREAGQ